MIATLGAQGAIAVTAQDDIVQPGFPARVLDSTGAGDCFIGALLAAALEGQHLQSCMRFACATASLSVSAIGARTGFPQRAAVAALLSRPT